MGVLGRDGFSNLTTRAIAQEAGVNQALINYHFGTKDKLLLEMMVALESGKYGRQWSMYHEADVPLSRKWRQAVNFYRDDLDDGFVRMTQELFALGSVNASVADRNRDHLNRWRSLLMEVAKAYFPDLGITVSPELIASAIVSFWIGISAQILAGAAEQDGHFFEVLDFVGDWLEERERRMASGGEEFRQSGKSVNAKDLRQD